MQTVVGVTGQGTLAAVDKGIVGHAGLIFIPGMTGAAGHIWKKRPHKWYQSLLESINGLTVPGGSGAVLSCTSLQP